MTTTSLVAYFTWDPEIHEYIESHTWPIVVLTILAILILIVVGFNHNAARAVPANYILLMLFTFSASYLIAVICLEYDTEVVINALLMTIGLTIGLTIYACIEKRAISIGFQFATNCLCITCCFGFAGLIIGSVGWFTLMMSAFLVFLYGVYLVVDISRILQMETITPDDYILGTLLLYVDIIALFLRILTFLKKAEKKK
jgi:FtsH-binding integral membrane protein